LHTAGPYIGVILDAARSDHSGAHDRNFPKTDRTVPLAVDGDIIAQIYKERVSRRGYGSGAWGWQTAYRETIGS
jgi:hypothetical protein